MARKAKKRKSERQILKDHTWKWMAKYIKLREATSQKLDPDYKYVRCCTCGRLTERGTRACQAGHYIGRGIGGSSGVYFDERNVHVQCVPCNGFMQGNHDEYEKFMLERYGQEVVDELKFNHKVHIYKPAEILLLCIFYKEQYEKLAKEFGVK